jgi:hypothetical protein|nr:MAG TPA: Endolysin [Caudoviricetes sp.]
MTFNEFYQGVNGKSLDYDGLYGYQCVDLVKVYLDWCFGIKPGAWGNAKDYWNILNRANVSDYFYQVPNTRDLVVERGDIVVWGEMSGNPYGHVAIGLSGDINHFTSLDQNWGSNYVREIYHNYDGVLGVLRVKDHSMLDGRQEPTPEPAPTKLNYNDKIKYRAHVQNIGWQNWVNGGAIAGTTERGLRMEALQLDLPFKANVKAHIERIGWVDYKDINRDTIIGTVGESRRLEALVIDPIDNEVPLTGKVHIQNRGWGNWYNLDGVISLGTSGQSLRMEAIQLWYEEL